MVNLSLLGAFAILTVLTTAAPSYEAIKEYHLKTKVISGDKTKDDLYGTVQATPFQSDSIQIYTQSTNSQTVTGYHTGAGTGDVALTSNATYALKGFLNGTYQQFDYNTSFPWGLYLKYPTYYTQWLVDLTSSFVLQSRELMIGQAYG
jgi:hypothetical protein